MADMMWKDAIVQVLRAKKAAMHYREITDAIVSGKLRTKVGKTPDSTVFVAITDSIKRDPETPFFRVGPARYALRELVTAEVAQPQTAIDAEAEEEGTPGLIKCFGMFWYRNQVHWKAKPNIWGRSRPTADLVDFQGQRGVYLLYDGREVVYVGRTTDRDLGDRLNEHTYDRLRGRWDRFSWFGVHDVAEGSKELVWTLGEKFDLDDLIVTMEALLIEGLEPRQNRKRGDDFGAREYIQGEDPKLRKQRELGAIDELRRRVEGSS